MKRIIIAALAVLAVAPAAASAQDPAPAAPIIYNVNFGKQAQNAVILPLTFEVEASSPDIGFSWSYFDDSQAYFRSDATRQHQLGPLTPVRKPELVNGHWVLKFVIRGVPQMDTHYLVETTAKFPSCSDCREGYLAGFKIRDPKPSHYLGTRMVGNTISARAEMSVITPLPSSYRASLSIQRFVRGSWHLVHRISAKGPLFTEREDERSTSRPLTIRYKSRQHRRCCYRVVFQYRATLDLGATLTSGRVSL